MKKRFERLCLPVTVYSLFLYLMSCTEEEIEKTFFLFGGAIPFSVKSKFNNSYSLKEYDRTGLMASKIYRECVYLRYVKWFVIPHNRRLKLFVQDHLKFCSYIIGKREYTLLEDAPHSNVFFVNGMMDSLDHNRRNMAHYKLARWFYGPVYGHSFGRNEQCTDILLWKYDDTPFLKSKNCHIVDLQEAWNNICEKKRLFLYNIWDINDDEIKELKKYPCVLITQPFYKIKGMDLVTNAVIYKSIAEKYPPQKLLIKTHPRDDFDYERILPGYTIFRKPIPLQLISLFGIRWEKVVTVNSSSVLDFDYPLEIDWYGNGCGRLLPDQFKRIPISVNVNLKSI